MNVLITGATGMVGEGVLLTCLQNSAVTNVISLSRKPIRLKHEKLQEIILKDFNEINQLKDQIATIDACFFCAGVSSIGENEASFYKKTYQLVVPFATTLSEINSNLVFTYVSGKGTDSTENGKTMWARVKGKTENALLKLPFTAVYNFRPGLMKPIKNQKNTPDVLKFVNLFYPLIKKMAPNYACTLQEVGLAMINSVQKSYSKNNIEVNDIIILAK